MSNKLDLFSLFEDVINESTIKEDEEVSWDKEREDADALFASLTKDKLHATTKTKKNKELKGSKKNQDEDDDAIDDDGVDNPDMSDGGEDDEKKISAINLEDASSYEKFVDDLNQFRAAHSFSDKEVSTELKSYFKKLTSDERKVLHIFVKSLIHITQPSLGVKGKTAQTPSDLSFNIKRSGVTSKEKKKSFEKRVSAEKQGKTVDTATPIVVGESKRQDKTNILKALLENR